jgi:hypothetical protein
VTTTITIDGSLDSHALEALQLEVKQLADGCGLEVDDIEVTTVERPLKRRGQPSMDAVTPERHVKRSKDF